MFSRTVGLLSMLALFNASCSSDDSGGTKPVADAGADVGVDGGARVTDRGKVTDFDTKKGVAGIVVTEGDATAVTDADGAFTITPLANTPVMLTFEGSKYTKLDWPEMLLSGDRDRGIVKVISLDTFHLVAGALDGYDPAFGVLYVSIKPVAPCTDTGGTSVEVLTPPNATVRYVVNGFPSRTATATSGKDDPGVAIYNLQPGVPVTLALTHPTCKQVAFPHTDGTATFTGNIVTEGGDTNSYAVFFME